MNPPASPPVRASVHPPSRWVLAACLALTLWTAFVPFTRAFYRIQINYNEGWNIYNATLAAAHQPLYPLQYSWTSNNYPMLSFAVVAGLHHVTHDYLFTARALSLLCLLLSALLIAAIVRRFTANRRAALLAACFTLALFCTGSDYSAYIGAADPQIFAQSIFLAGLCLYLANRRSLPVLAATALIFVTAGCIKHNLIEFPLAVLIDLLFLSVPRAVWFALCGILFAAIALYLNIHYGGPAFLHQLLAPRLYSPSKAILQSGSQLAPLILPLTIAAFTAIRLRRDPTRRILSILFALTLLIGCYFSGGSGVAANALFDVYLSMSLLVGLSLAHGLPFTGHGNAAPYATLALFAWLLIPWLIVPSLAGSAPAENWNPALALRHARTDQSLFDTEVAFLRDHPGPALCESLLRCFYAGKPYTYDPFNATRLIQLHHLDESILLNSLRAHQYAAIQLDAPIGSRSQSDRFTPDILTAIQQNYRPALTLTDAILYLPIEPGPTMYSSH